MNNLMQDLLLRLVRARRELGRLLQPSLFFVVICSLLGCNVGPRYARPVVPSPPAFKEPGPQQAPDGSTWKTAQPQDDALRGK